MDTMQPRILIVDDQPDVLDILKEILSRGPYTVLSAPSGEEALALMGRHPIDVVISDERMPGMQGSEFLAVARQRHPDAMRIILTGHASVEATIRAINEGEIFRFLTKPVNNEDLHTAVAEALANKKNKEAEQNCSLLANLEKQAPGITQVKRDTDGVIIIDEEA
jgi:two-component system, probable response regulator PhcQ